MGKNAGEALEFASKKLKDDRHVVDAALRCSAGAIRYVGPRHRKKLWKKCVDSSGLGTIRTRRSRVFNKEIHATVSCRYGTGKKSAYTTLVFWMTLNKYKNKDLSRIARASSSSK